MGLLLYTVRCISLLLCSINITLLLTDPEDPLKDLYDVDDETTVSLIQTYPPWSYTNVALLLQIWQVGDWWHNTTLPLLAGYVATGIVPVSDSGTFNGVGRFNGGPEVPFFVVNVVQGTRYRFRIINTSARNVFTMSIDSHNMTVSIYFFSDLRVIFQY